MPPRYGKAIDCETDMLTSRGWVKAKDVKLNDFIFGKDGNKTKVIGVYPQGKTDAYKVEFSDGSYLVTCSEHLWTVKNRYRKNYEVLKTKNLIGKLYANDGHKLWNIPKLDGLNIEENKSLLLDPYLLGCWLGDGHTHSASITTMDEEIISKFKDFDPVVRTHQNSGKALTYGLRNNFVTILKQLNVFKNKHIPLEYLLSSKEQRLELLRGLCDTDGTINKKTGQVSFCSTNKVLLQNVKELICSLGGVYKEYRNSLFFKLEYCTFKLSRKVYLWKPLNNRHFTKRFITSITKVEDRETVCFTVDAEDSLFCAGRDFIVTHNTELAVKNFIAKGLAINPASKFIHLSYASSLALDNSEEIRGIVTSDEYTRIFPEVQLSKSSKAKNKWYTTEGGGVYATATGGQITGFGAGEVDDEELIEELESHENSSKFAGAIVIDDPLKPDDADSDIKRERINQRFENTIRSRANSRNTPIIIIGQAVHERDLIGYLLETEPEKWELLNIPAIIEDEEGERALWDFKHTLEELYHLRDLDPRTFRSQYQQDPSDVEGKLIPLTSIKFTEPPKDEPIGSYGFIDPADTGGDALSAIFVKVYEVEEKLFFYVNEVIHTTDGIEAVTERLPEYISRNETSELYIEANGLGLAMVIGAKRKLKEMDIKIVPVTAKENKLARILGQYEKIISRFIFNSNQNKEYKLYIKHLTGFAKDASNSNSKDAIDNTSLASKILDVKYRKILYKMKS